MNSLRKPWICVIGVACFVFSGHLLQLAESVTWKHLPSDPTKAITGSTASLAFGYELEKNEDFTYGEFRRITGGTSSDIGDINADGVITVVTRIAKKMSLTATNNSALLSIRGIEIPDQAEYCCKIVTSQEREEKCIHLKVLVPPKLDVSPLDKTVNETESLDLFCNATGIPAPDISWTKVGSDKQLSQKEHLVINSARKEDSGIYVCRASSEAGNVTAKALVKVQYKPRNTTLRSNAVMNTVTTDGSVTFNCSTDAKPPAHVFSLYHEGSIIARNASFTIERVAWSDQGKYTCVPSNILGAGKNASIALTLSAPTTSKGSSGRKISNWLITAGPILGGIVFLLIVGDF